MLAASPHLGGMEVLFDGPAPCSSKFTLTSNLKAVQALGLELPMGLMLSANEASE